MDTREEDLRLVREAVGDSPREGAVEALERLADRLRHLEQVEAEARELIAALPPQTRPLVERAFPRLAALGANDGPCRFCNGYGNTGASRDETAWCYHCDGTGRAPA